MDNNIYKNILVIAFCALFLFITIIMLIRFPVLTDEAEIGISLNQIAPVISEKSFYSGDELIIPFSCGKISAERWVVQITATANPANIGYITLKINNFGEKKLRTGVFNKIAGTYSIPFYIEPDKENLEKNYLYIKFTGGNKKEPLFYLANMVRGSSVLYQIVIQPEREYLMNVHRRAIYPKYIKRYKPLGECKKN